MNLLIAVLVVGLYALVVLLILTVVFWIVGLFGLTLTAPIKQIIYAIVGLLFLIYLLQVVFGSGQGFVLPGLGMRGRPMLGP